MPVTFRKELVTDTWFIPPSLRRLCQIITSGTGAEEAWHILTNPENNNALNDLVRNHRVTRNSLELVLDTALADWNRADNDIDEGLIDLQAEHDPDSAIPSTDDDDDLNEALGALYVVPQFQNRFIHELPSPMGNSQASTQATSGRSASSRSSTSNDSGSASNPRSGDDVEEGEEEEEEEEVRVGD